METGLSIINEVEGRLGWRKTDTLDSTTPRKETTKLLTLLNRVLRAAQSLDDWPLLRTDGTILSVEDISETRAMLFSNGCSIVQDRSGSNDFDETLIGRAFHIDGFQTVYRIDDVPSNLSLQLNRIWVHDSSTGGIDGQSVTFTIAQDRYALPRDFDRPTGGWRQFLSPYKITPIGPEEFFKIRSERGNTILTDQPRYFTVYGLTDDGVYQQIHFDPYFDEQQILSFTYQKNHPKIETDDDRILFPLRMEEIIVEAMLYLANRDYDDNSKLEVVLRDYFQSINTIRGTDNVAEDKMRITPSGAHRIAQYQKWNRGSRNVDWGTFFDRADKVGFP